MISKPFSTIRKGDFINIPGQPGWELVRKVEAWDNGFIRLHFRSGRCLTNAATGTALVKL